MKRVLFVMLMMAAVVAPRATSADIVDVTYSTNGISSWDGLGDPDNFLDFVSLGAGFTDYHVIGIGWDVNLTAISPSWLSEIGVNFVEGGVFLFPGSGDGFPGSANYSSGGIVDLIGLSLDWNQASDILNLEFFEDFDDVADAIEGSWDSGTITIRVERSGAIPEPASIGIAALGVAGFLVRRRRS